MHCLLSATTIPTAISCYKSDTTISFSKKRFKKTVPNAQRYLQGKQAKHKKQTTNKMSEMIEARVKVTLNDQHVQQPTTAIINQFVYEFYLLGSI